jgi:outer membrane protein assembly factor BamB
MDVKDGRVLWQKEYMKDYNAPSPLYGFVGSPLVDAERLICIVGGEGNKKVIAFNKMTGEEIWSALKTTGEPGYGQPMIINYGGTRQLIIWHGTAVSSLDPVTGKVYWEVPFPVDLNLTIGTPVQDGPFLYVATHYSGSVMIRLGETKPTGELLWKTDLSDDGINPASMTPIIDGNYVYGLNGFGILRCLDINTGKRVWESQALTKEHVLYTSAQFVKHADGRYFVTNDRGELVMARITPKGYEEISRTKVITPTHPGGRRREFGAVNWSYPAYANKHLFIRNDNEIVSYSLAK